MLEAEKCGTGIQVGARGPGRNSLIDRKYIGSHGKSDSDGLLYDFYFLLVPSMLSGFFKVCMYFSCNPRK